MNAVFGFVVFTSNILGSFNDPFEFEGNYGEEVNPIRETVFEQVVSKEALATHLTDFQIKQLINSENPTADEIEHYRRQLIMEAIQKDFEHGPTLNELISSDLVQRLTEKQQELQNDGFAENDLQNFLYFMERYGDQKVFSFFQHHPSELLSLDKILHDQAARKGREFDLPILGSTQPLRGNNNFELKENLLNALFTKDILSVTESEDKLMRAIEKLDPAFLKQYLGKEAITQDLMIFTSPAGQVFFYWLYQSLHLHLITHNVPMIPQINNVKQVFAETLGNPSVRAQMFREQFIAANASVIFTQESDVIVPLLLSENGLFHSTINQNPADGTFVFLRSNIWDPSYQAITIDDYEGYHKGRLNVVLATKKDSGEKFLLASCHGNSTRAEDGRLQIQKIMEKFHQLNQSLENKDLQLVIGIDANTKTDKDVELLHEHLESLGLMATSVGPTTIKKRMVTIQHAKAGRFAIDEEDYVIVLKSENGGLYQMTNPTVGFKEERPDPTITLPNVNNPSDHYPVGATLIYTQTTSK